MTPAREAIPDLCRDPTLHCQHARLVRVRMERPRERPRDDPRRFDRGLRVHPEVHDVAEDLDHRLALRVLAGAAERHERAAILHEERRVRRKARPLVRGDRRRMARRRPELRATRRDDHAEAADERRTETRVGRCRGEGVPFGVHRARERGVRCSHAHRDPRAIPGRPGPSLVAPGIARRGELRVRAVVADRRAALFRVGLVQQTAHRYVDLLRIAEEALTIRGGKLERLRVPVQELERPRPKGRDVRSLEEIQGHRYERALRPRAARVDIDAAIRRVRRRIDADALRAKVAFGDRAAGLAHESRDLLGDVSLVDRVARRHDRVRPARALVRSLDPREAPEQCPELALSQDLADARRPSIWQEDRRARRPLPQPLLETFDRGREPRIHGKAIAEVDRRGEHLREREPAVPRERGEPRVSGRRRHRSRHTDGHVVAVPRAVRREIERRRPVPEPVDRFRSGHPRAVHDDRRDAAEVGEVPLEDVQRDARRDARVDRVAASLEHPHSGERREVVARADHVTPREDRRATLTHRDRWRGVLDGDLTHDLPL